MPRHLIFTLGLVFLFSSPVEAAMDGIIIGVDAVRVPVGENITGNLTHVPTGNCVATGTFAMIVFGRQFETDKEGNVTNKVVHESAPVLVLGEAGPFTISTAGFEPTSIKKRRSEVRLFATGSYPDSGAGICAQNFAIPTVRLFKCEVRINSFKAKIAKGEFLPPVPGGTPVIVDIGGSTKSDADTGAATVAITSAAMLSQTPRPPIPVQNNSFKTNFAIGVEPGPFSNTVVLTAVAGFTPTGEATGCSSQAKTNTVKFK